MPKGILSTFLYAIIALDADISASEYFSISHNRSEDKRLLDSKTSSNLLSCLHLGYERS